MNKLIPLLLLFPLLASAKNTKTKDVDGLPPKLKITFDIDCN